MCIFFYLLALQICCCNVDIKGSIYSIMNLSICNFHLNQRKRKHGLVKIVRSILLCRMSCFLYSILVGLVHSLSINQILPKKNGPKIYTRKMSLRNSWRHCGLMTVAIMWCFFSALWKKEFKILKQKPMSNKQKVLQKAKCFYYAIFSYMRIFLIINLV